MEWIRRFNDALSYIEENLEAPDVQRAAEFACCSGYHFMRVFSYIAGMPLGEYIRRRRMTLCALELQGGSKVIDLALKYGYDSPTAFNRAFKSVHGVSPSVAKEQGTRLVAYPPIAFHISIKGDEEMQYRIEQKEAFRIVGLKKTFAMDVEGNFQEVPVFWGEVAQSGQIPRVMALMNKAPFGLLGVSAGDYGKPESGTAIDYYIAVSSDAKAPEGMEAYEIPAATWAIFEGDGPMPAAMQGLQRRVFSEWLPASGYEYGDAPDVEVYLSEMRPDGTQPFEVWLPIVKK